MKRKPAAPAKRRDMPTKPKGAEKRLCSLTYSMIAAWVGLPSRTVQQYASLGEFHARRIESVLQWVNKRRQVDGLPLIGAVPTKPKGAA